MGKESFNGEIEKWKKQRNLVFAKDFENRINQLPSVIGEELALLLLKRRDAAAVFPKKMIEKFPARNIATSGISGDINKAWETAGLLYMHSGRVADALDIFDGFYHWLLQYQEETGHYLHKGFPLVWMAECCRRAGFHFLAKRFLMLTLCEDSIKDNGKINPDTSGVYFRLVWQSGMNDSDLRRYAKEMLAKYQSDPKNGLYPEWVLQELDNEWITIVPTPNESMIYRVNSSYIKFLLKKLGEGSGKNLEILAEYVLSLMPGCRTYRRRKTYSSEYDLVCTIEGTESDFRSEFGRYFVCECKDLNRPANFTTIAKFCRVLDSAKSRFGILFSTKGVTGSKKTEHAAREIIKVFQDRGIVIVVIDENDLRNVADGKNFITILRTKYEKSRLDIP